MVNKFLTGMFPHQKASSSILLTEEQGRNWSELALFLLLAC